MKIALFGGTGRTGQHVLRYALDRGYEVSALARSPGKLQIHDPRLRIIRGDATDARCVEETIRGVDAVISVLGPTENTQDHRVTKATQHILAAMRQHHVRRLVISAGAGVGDPNDSPGPINKFINLLLKLTSRHVYEDMLEVASAVRRSEVDWTIVRVPMLTDDPATGKVITAYVGKGMGMKISREDMARFMIDQIGDSTYLYQAPAISN
jgi:nucleoside-diphosphate-sugar epimerase